MFHNIKGKKHGLKFVIKGKKVFLCDTNLNICECKDIQNHSLGYEMYDLWRDPCGDPFFMSVE